MSNPAANDAWVQDIRCGHCGSTRTGGAVLVRSQEGQAGGVWVRCNSCQGALAGDSTDKLFPAPGWGQPMQGLSDQVRAAYDEARDCMKVNAFTASELMCRKLLMYVACDKLKEPEGRSFEAYVVALIDGNLITSTISPFADQIRKNANRSTHDLAAPSEKRAVLTLTFTTALLHEVYELPYLMEQNLESESPDGD